MADRLLPRGSDLCDELLGRMIQLPETLLDGLSRAIGRGGYPATAAVPIHLFPAPPPGAGGLSPSVDTSSSSSIPFPYGFESQFGPLHPLFHASTLACALDLGRAERRPVFVYLHSQRHPDTDAFCAQTLCSEVVVQFLDANFVCWGAAATDEDDDVGEGVQMAAALGARQFPFCAVVVPADGDNVVLLQEVQGAVSPSELVEALQCALEEASAFMELASEEKDVEHERQRLWETLDAQYRETCQMNNKLFKNGFRVIVIEGDDSTDWFSSSEEALSKDSPSEDADMLAVDIGSSTRQWSSVPVAVDQRRDGALRMTIPPRRPASARGRTDKEELTAGTDHGISRAISGSRRRLRSAPPPPGRNGKKDDSADQPVTLILIRFPNGQAREQAFLKTDTIRDVFRFVDSLSMPPAAGTEGGYRLISGFPRKVYGHDHLDTSLLDAGLHPRATLLLEQLN